MRVHRPVRLGAGSGQRRYRRHAHAGAAARPSPWREVREGLAEVVAFIEKRGLLVA